MINEALSVLQPEATARLQQMNQAAWAAADSGLLQLCRCLIVTLLEEHTVAPLTDPAAAGLAPEKAAALGNWAAADVYSPLERAALAFTEQFVVAVSAVSDEQVEALREHLGDEETYAFAAAIYVIEMSERLRIVSAAVIGEGRNN